MEIIVEPQKKNIFVKIGALRIFGKDKRELKDDEQRITRFDDVWAEGLRSALEQAIKENLTVDAHLVREFKVVPFVRFQKSMSTRFTTNNIPMSLLEANLESQRTVIIVHAPKFPQLLRRWDFT